MQSYPVFFTLGDQARYFLYRSLLGKSVYTLHKTEPKNLAPHRIFCLLADIAFGSLTKTKMDNCPVLKRSAQLRK